MLIKNNGTNPITMNLRDGSSYVLQPGVPTSVPDAATTMIDDSPVLIALFNAGTLTVTTDAGGAFSGFPTVVNASDSAAGKLLTVRAKVSAGGGRTLIDETGQAVGWNALIALKTKFLASLVNGAKYREQRSLAAIPDWAAGTLVVGGYVCKNAGNIYWLLNTLSTGSQMNNAAGVTTVTAPTGTGPNVIQTATDNLQWLYLGPYTADVQSLDQIDTPAWTTTTVPGNMTRRYDPQNAADASAMYLTGSDFSNQLAPGGGVAGVAAVTYANSASVDFVTDAPAIFVNRVQNGGGMAFSPTINGAPLWYKQGMGYPWVVSGSNNYYGMLVDWTGKPQRERRFRLPLGNKVWTGVWVDPKYSIWQPKNPNRYRLYVEGDSVTQGANPNNGSIGACHKLAAILGCDDVWDSSTGGTGFINSGGGSTLITRIPRVIAAAPDILYVRPINNDVGNDTTYNSTSRIATYLQYFNTLLAALPNLVIICGGGYATVAANLSTAANSAWQVEADMAAAIAQFNSPQVKFLPMISDPAGRWLYGDGHVGTTSNSTHGNSDLLIGDGFDTLHPNVRYYETMLRREANGIISIMNGIT